MCNQEVKFKLFLEAALEHGADMIATGHYAARRTVSYCKRLTPIKTKNFTFYRVRGEALSQNPISTGRLHQTARQISRRTGLYHGKPDSQGICFVGPNRHA